MKAAAKVLSEHLKPVSQFLDQTVGVRNGCVFAALVVFVGFQWSYVEDEQSQKTWWASISFGMAFFLPLGINVVGTFRYYYFSHAHCV